MGPVYLVIFCYWVGPVPYLELFGAGPVEKNTLYFTREISGKTKEIESESYIFLQILSEIVILLENGCCGEDLA